MDSMKNWKKWLKLASLAAVVVTAAMTNALGKSNPAATGSLSNSMKSIKTYLSFSKEIDPANIVTMADLEISTALSSPLVEFNGERQVVSGIAETWTVLPPNQMKFVLREKLRWSDGSAVRASEYKAALERARKLYGNDLRALFDSVEKIEAIDDRTIVFTTKGDVTQSGLLLKLTEPMYGLLSIKAGNLDLTKSVGPFFVKEKWTDELILAANPQWYAFSKEIPAIVEIRRPNEGQGTITSFERDEWANLVSVSSLMPSETKEHLKSIGYKTWQRSLDKVYGLFASKRFIKTGDGAALLKRLSSQLDRTALMGGLSGYIEAEQFFPRGYVLHSSKQPKVEASAWKHRDPISLAIFAGPMLSAMTKELANEISKTVGKKVNVVRPPVTKLDEVMKKGDFDIMAVALAVADPNFEGAMSFFIEKEPPFIQSKTGENDFAGQLRAARGLPTSDERASRMREIIVRTQEAGHVLPLFHFSSLAIAKPGIDLSGIPNSDETVLFSKVRMK